MSIHSKILAEQTRVTAERDLHNSISDADHLARRALVALNDARREVDVAYEIAASLDHASVDHLARADALLGPIYILLDMTKGLLHDADQEVHS